MPFAEARKGGSQAPRSLAPSAPCSPQGVLEIALHPCSFGIIPSDGTGSGVGVDLRGWRGSQCRTFQSEGCRLDRSGGCEVHREGEEEPAFFTRNSEMPRLAGFSLIADRVLGSESEMTVNRRIAVSVVVTLKTMDWSSSCVPLWDGLRDKQISEKEHHHKDDDRRSSTGFGHAWHGTHPSHPQRHILSFRLDAHSTEINRVLF